ncbi:MAG: flagellar hook-length control protein FliK [Paracoccaceae bacterium]|nr:flagellar hook-length control protein FliK [Paracoccaceae bacterium]
MVSINISTSFLETNKPGDPSSDTDISGLENIFASMLTLIEEENKITGGQDKLDSSGGVVGLLETIKKEIKLNQNTVLMGSSNENASGAFSSKIFQIYQTYKTLIDEAIEIGNGATISFNMERLLKAQPLQNNTIPSHLREIESSVQISSNETIQISSTSSITDINGSIEEFSELEMQRVKASMKHQEVLTNDSTSNVKKNIVGTNDTDAPLVKKLFEQSKSKQSINKENITTIIDQTDKKSKLPRQTADLPKAETLMDQTQVASKANPSKSNFNNQTLQSSQSTDQMHLKLLEKSWGKDLAKIIEKAILSGKEKIDISLDPQRLGKMHLSLSVVNNQTSVFIGTESTAASLILTNAEERLAQMFESAGYKLSNFQANSNGKNNSNHNESESKHDKSTRNKGVDTEQLFLSEKEDQASYIIDGRKIINIIA